MGYRLLLCVGWLCPPSAWAQADAGGIFAPQAIIRPARKDGASAPPLTPLALAASLALDATSWARLQTLAPSPAHEFARLQRKGYYKSELFWMIALSLRAGESLDRLVAERDKGARLRAMAEKRKLDYDAVYSDAAALEARAEAILPSILTVRVSTGAAPGAAPERPGGGAPPPGSGAPPPKPRRRDAP